MTDAAPPEASAPPERAAADPAVRRHTARLRPWRIAYALGIVAALAALLAVVVVAYQHGEISHVTLHTAAEQPRSVAPGTPAAAPGRAWHSDDAAALGYPLAGGTVITHDAHAVRGRNVLTGKVTWSYTRTDRTVCAALQTDAVTVAVYEVNGNCDELTGLATATGQRQWTRTLDKDSNVVQHALNGHPNYAVTSDTVLLWTPQVAYAIDPSGNQDHDNKAGGLDRWVFAHTGCTIRSLVLGSAGALISQTCRGQDCTGQKDCGNGPQLLLRDRYTGENNDSSKNNGNPDQLKWNLIGSQLIPASADAGVITAVSPDGTALSVLAANTGKVQQELPLDGGTGPVSAMAAGETELVRFAGVTYAVQPNRATAAWQLETAGPPYVTSANGTAPASLDRALITVVTTSGLAELDPTTGAVRKRFTTSPSPAAQSTAIPVGNGFLIAGTTTAFYR